MNHTHKPAAAIGMSQNSHAERVRMIFAFGSEWPASLRSVLGISLLLFRAIPQQPGIKTQGRQERQSHHSREGKNAAAWMDARDATHFDHRDGYRQQEDLEHVPRIDHADDAIGPRADL